MWIRIDRMRTRIQDNKITKLISINLLKVEKKKYIFKSIAKPWRLATFLGSELKNIISNAKKPNFLVKLLHFIPLDPRTQRNAEPTGSGSRFGLPSLILRVHILQNIMDVRGGGDKKHGVQGNGERKKTNGERNNKKKSFFVGGKFILLEARRAGGKNMRDMHYIYYISVIFLRRLKMMMIWTQMRKPRPLPFQDCAQFIIYLFIF